ncbi:hypothetical protein J4N42_05370 [Vibrio sp. SCSIO 43135]|uniref:hypothetical protein n=1 Tax=Vibrio sp. SCSIO 43135 TaxID=2819096 RepID=UPI002076253A|nr:hypothetical protein [Vibrio sp. SCSIO 43135]USD42152.1 hypothetical protein J4N42_05370 [Vibrio sp. SCSIO 43135]
MGKNIDFDEKFVNLYAHTIDKRSPGCYRLNDLHSIANIKGKAPWGSNELPWLDSIFEQLMTNDGEHLYYSGSKVQTYSRLAAQIDPMLLVGWYLSGSPRDMNNLEKIIPLQTPFFVAPSGHDKSYSEGHVHYGGVGGGFDLLSAHLLEPNEDVDEHLVTYKDMLDNFRLLFLTLIRKICNSVLDEHSLTFEECFKASKSPLGYSIRNWDLLADSCLVEGQYEENSAAWCIGKFAQSVNLSTSTEWLWLFTGFCKHYRYTESKKERAAILCWIQICNFLQSEAVMDGIGLSRFTSRYFFHPIRNNAKHGLTKIPLLFSEKNDCAEIKITPGLFSPSFLSQFSKDLAKHQNVEIGHPAHILGESDIDPNDSVDYLSAMEKWHFCCHFSRQSNSSYPKNRKIKDSWKSAEDLVVKLNTKDGWNKPEYLGGRDNEKLDFDPSHWVRGLDVAGDENALAIEWFAPILRWLRSDLRTSQGGRLENFGFHLSVHAGEDYAHPASGLRKVDETVQFCEMKEGDRLGHALALGIEPNDWIDRQGQVLLPLDEHLDNLVWLWHHAKILDENYTLPLAGQCLPILEQRIITFSTKYNEILSGLIEPIAPSILYKAWVLRKNCHYTFRTFINDVARSPKEKEAVPDWQLLATHMSSSSTWSPEKLYLERHAYIKGDRWKQSAMPMVMVTKTEPYSHDSVFFELKETLSDRESYDELLLMAAIQDYLLTKYHQQGLLIEVNPTSNLYIARLRELKEHPIFRWSGPDTTLLENENEHNRFGLRSGPVDVTINTDDPGIMPTTLRTEFSLLKEAAVAQGIEEKQVEEWLETLRIYGNERFKSSHRTVFEFERGDS